MGAMRPAVREREEEGGCVSVGGGVRSEVTAAWTTPDLSRQRVKGEFNQKIRKKCKNLSMDGWESTGVSQ